MGSQIATNVALTHLKTEKAMVDLQENMSITNDKDPALQVEIAVLPRASAISSSAEGPRSPGLY